MKSPKINRAIGYLVLFSGFAVFYKGFHPAVDTPGGKPDVLLVSIAFAVIIAAFVWMLLKVRCPHCNSLLNLKLGNINTCPYCGEDTTP